MDWRNREIWVLRQMGEMETSCSRPLRPLRVFFAFFAVKIFCVIERNPKTLTAKNANNFREVRKEI